MDDNQNILDEYLQNEHKEDYIKQLLHNGYMMSLCILPTMKVLWMLFYNEFILEKT